MELGYTLSSEERRPDELVRQAARAEAAGFTFAGISDHYHPWVDAQGQSPFVWAVLGGVAQVTERLVVHTGVTCPFRVHPAIVAQAAATVAAMMEGRFILGLGSGEALNEHVTGTRWPSVDVRQEMLEEAVGIIRVLWRGELTSHYGKHFTVEDARVYTLPRTLPPIHVAAAGKRAAQLAGRIGDGLIATAPNPEIVQAFSEAGGAGKPRTAQVHVCWAADEARAKETAFKVWPNAATPGGAMVELPLPQHFEQLASGVSPEQVAQAVTCGPDPQKHVEAIRKYEEAGFDRVYVHQVGPDQDGFFSFYEREVMPSLARAAAPVPAAAG